MRTLNLIVPVLAVLAGGTAHGDAKVRPAGNDIVRLDAQAVVPATAPEVTAALVGARWMYLNPAKKTSTWESRTYELRADGTVDVVTNDLVTPTTDKEVWKVVATGKAPAIQLGAQRLRIVACSRGQTATLCLAR